MGVHTLLNLSVDGLRQRAVSFHLGNGHIVIDAVLLGLIVPDCQNLEQPAQHRHVRGRRRKGGGHVQAANHHQTGGRHADAPAEAVPLGAAGRTPLADALPDPLIQLLRNRGGLILISCLFELVHVHTSLSKDTRSFFSPA